ncbi:MAG: hypothetical protein ACREIC_24000 [Limisphaerales bacterium]
MGDTEQAAAHASATVPAGVQQQLVFHFIKSTQFRVVYANGAWFGGDAQHNIHLTFYNERSPIPKKYVVNLDSSGVIVSEDESQREVKEGLIRELEIDVVLSIDSAIQFHQMLGMNLESLRKRTE